jgi:hypothetical protein
MYMCDVRGNHLAYNSKFCSMVCVSRRSQFCNGLAQFGPDSKNTGCLKKSSTRNILWDLLNQNRAVPAAAEETNNVCHQFLDQLCFTFMMFVRICARNVHVLTWLTGALIEISGRSDIKETINTVLEGCYFERMRRQLI